MSRYLHSFVVSALMVVVSTAGVLLNSAALGAEIPDFSGQISSPPAGRAQTAVLAGGCFWGVDAVFRHVKGVSTVVSGYSGGDRATANYEAVSTGATGHAEAVSITYDPAKISYAQLLRVFFAVAHDPTEMNRQGPDTGTQYRSAIFYANEEQKQLAQDYIGQLNKAGVFPAPIVTQVVPLKQFYPAEDYHQNYLARHPYQPYIVIHDMPKLEQLKKRFPAIYR